MRRRSLLVLSAGLALVLVLAVPGSAQTDSVRIRQIDADAFPTVSLTFSGAEGLEAGDLRVTESGGQARVLSLRPLSAAGEGFDVVVAIDTSNSVAGEPLAAAIAAARTFVTKLPPKTAIGLVTFSDEVRTVEPITSDHEAVLEAIDLISSTQRGTRLHDAVAEASKLFEGRLQHNIVLLTDGADVGSTSSLQEAVASAKKARAGVFTIGLGEQADTAILERLASQTKGSFLTADQSNLEAIYTSIAGELTRQYVVLYRSNAAPGSQVTVAVTTSGGSSDQAFVLMPKRLALEIPPEKSFPGGLVGLTIILALAFAAAFILILSAAGSAARLRRDRLLAKRMGAQSLEPTQWHELEEVAARGGWLPEGLTGAGEKIAEIGGFASGLDTKLERAGLPMKSGEFVMITVMSTLFGLLLGGLALRNPIVALILGVVGALTPRFYVSFKLNNRVSLLHEQLPDVLLIMASSLRAGHSFLQSLDMVAKEIGEPAAPEFARVIAEVRLGRPVDEALLALAERVGTEEFKWAVMAVNVQREVGGNLAEILDSVAETVRERDAIHRQIRVLSGEARFSIRILIALPIIVAGLISLINPEYMRVLWSTRIGWFAIVIGVSLMLIGVLWARKMVKIDV